MGVVVFISLEWIFIDFCKLAVNHIISLTIFFFLVNDWLIDVPFISSFHSLFMWLLICMMYLSSSTSMC